MDAKYKTSFSRAMGSTESFVPDDSVTPPPAQRGARKALVKGKPSGRPVLTHKTLGDLKITYACDRTYSTAAEVHTVALYPLQTAVLLAIPGKSVPKGRPKNDPVFFLFFWAKTCQLGRMKCIKANFSFLRSFLGHFWARLGFWVPGRAKIPSSCLKPFSCIFLNFLHINRCN